MKDGRQAQLNLTAGGVRVRARTRPVRPPGPARARFVPPDSSMYNMLIYSSKCTYVHDWIQLKADFETGVVAVALPVHIQGRMHWYTDAPAQVKNENECRCVKTL